MNFGTPTPPPPPEVPKPIAPPMQPQITPDFGKKSTGGGIQSTILTSPLGDLRPARTTRKSLLGGGSY